MPKRGRKPKPKRPVRNVTASQPAVPPVPAYQMDAGQTATPPPNPDTARRSKAIMNPGLRATIGALIMSGLVAGGTHAYTNRNRMPPTGVYYTGVTGLEYGRV